MEYFREHEKLDAAVDGRMTILPRTALPGESTSIQSIRSALHMGQDSPAVPLRMLFCRLQFLCGPTP